MITDPRDAILQDAYKKNAVRCADLGHRYVPDLALNGDFLCGYCHAIRAMTPPQDNDQSVERISA